MLIIFSNNLMFDISHISHKYWYAVMLTVSSNEIIKIYHKYKNSIHYQQDKNSSDSRHTYLTIHKILLI